MSNSLYLLNHRLGTSTAGSNYPNALTLGPDYMVRVLKELGVIGDLYVQTDQPDNPVKHAHWNDVSAVSVDPVTNMESDFGQIKHFDGNSWQDGLRIVDKNLRDFEVVNYTGEGVAFTDDFGGLLAYFGTARTEIVGYVGISPSEAYIAGVSVTQSDIGDVYIKNALGVDVVSYFGGSAVISGVGISTSDSDSGVAFTDKFGGVSMLLTENKLSLAGLESSTDGNAKIGFLELETAESESSQAVEVDGFGGVLSSRKGGEYYNGGLYFSSDYILNESGDILASAPLAKWKPFVTDSPASSLVSPSAAVTSISGYNFPIVTSNRYYRSGYDLAVMEAASIPSVACWPSGRIIRANTGKSGVAGGVSGEGKGAHIRLSVRSGEVWRHVWYIVPTDFINEACVDAFISRLPDNRALLVFPHDGGIEFEYATAICIENPESDPADWVFGSMCNIGRGFPGKVVKLDNGDSVGTVSQQQLGVGFPNYSPLFGNRYGYFTVAANNDVSFTVLGTIPPVEPGEDYNKWQETSVVQTNYGELFAMFRTNYTYHYSVSLDQGLTWSSPLEFTGFPTIDAKAFLSRLPDGRLLGIANHNNGGVVNDNNRRDLTLYLSDIGASPLGPYPYSKTFEDRSWCTYPHSDYVVDDQGRYRGEIVFVYDHGRNTKIDTDTGNYIANLLYCRFNVLAFTAGFTNLEIEEASL